MNTEAIYLMLCEAFDRLKYRRVEWKCDSLNEKSDIYLPKNDERFKPVCQKRKARDPEFAENYETGYLEFKIGVLLRQAREEAGLTQEEGAEKLNTKKSAISRMENHAEDVRLSTLGKYAKVLGKKLHLSVG